MHPEYPAPRPAVSVLAALLLVASIVAFAFVNDGINDTEQAQERGVATNATIMNRDCTYAPAKAGGGHCTNLVAYTFDGEPLEVTKFRWNRPEGDTFTILVDPDNPESFTVESLRTGDGTFRTLIGVALAALAAVAFAARRGLPAPSPTPGRVELAATWAPVGALAAGVSAASVAGATVAGMTGLGDRSGALITFGAAAASALAGTNWLRNHAQLLVLTDTEIKVTYGSGKQKSVALGPDSSWIARQVQGLKKRRRFVAVYQIKDGNDTVTVRASSWGPGSRATSELVGNVLRSSGTPRVPK